MNKNLFFVLCFSLSAFALPPNTNKTDLISNNSLSVDNGTYINANKIFMFVTNHGNFGRDLGGAFGYDYGTFYPYKYLYDIENDINVTSPLYAAGIWIGGKINDSVHVTISEYSSEFVPGPMLNGTFQTDRDEFKTYKLYYDSLEDNPNDDYTNWPINQGAPVDSLGRPRMKGHQILWSVYNDADTNQHINMNSNPLGIEIQQTTYAQYETGIDTTIITENLTILALGHVNAEVIDTSQITGDEYMIILNYNDTTENYWSLSNITTGETLLDNQTTDTSDIIDGFQLYLNLSRSSYHYFETVANGAGVLDPSEPAAFAFRDFPTPDDGNPSDLQQVGDGLWAIGTGDNGGTSGDGNRGPYSAFLERTFRGDSDRIERFGNYDWEIRFTGSNDNPGVGGGYACEWYTTEHAHWVPFELWRSGIGTPDDPSDDLRIIPWTIGDGGDSMFYMSSWGSDATGNCGPGGCEHSASGGDNDPYTDLIYWRIPSDNLGNEAVSGDSAYMVFENTAIADPSMTGYPFNELPVMDRMVLINWNGDKTSDASGGATVPSGYNQDLPEEGTIFRISKQFNYTPDTILFVTPETTIKETHTTYSPEHTSIYFEYKLYNKSNNFIDSCYFSLWTDPDLGGSGDDFVGCDSLSDIFFCYNASDDDYRYGDTTPALGFKFIHGPLIPSVGDTAIFDNSVIYDYTNTGMSSSNAFIGALDPEFPLQAFRYMKGLSVSGDIYYYDTFPTKYMLSGDPISGNGDIDKIPSDRRVMGTVGPFSFAPGDSQYVKIKMAIGQGGDRLSSIKVMKDILNSPEKVITNPEPWPPVKELPTRFTIAQNYPNPFNPSTQIAYDVPSSAHVNIEIYNILGRKVKTLIDKHQVANNYIVEWDGTGYSGDKLATGLYFYKITAGEFTDSKKMLLLK